METCVVQSNRASEPIILNEPDFPVLWKWKWSDIRPSMVTHTRNLCSAFDPSKCTHTRSSGQPFLLQRPGSSWGFGALLKGTSVVVLRVERVLYIHTPHLQSLPARDLNSQPFDYESDSLTIRPWLPEQPCTTWKPLNILCTCNDLHFCVHLMHFIKQMTSVMKIWINTQIKSCKVHHDP